MGDCGQNSKFVTMQLFHELKQQFPTIPDHIVSQCIVQSNHDRETCTQRLRAKQDSRPPPGAFPPPAPSSEVPAEEKLYLSELKLSTTDQQPPAASLDTDTRSTAVPTSSQESSPHSQESRRPFFQKHDKPGGFALSVNVNCGPAVETRDLLTTREVPQSGSSIPSDPTTRNVTSVSLILRPPSSESQEQFEQPSSSSSIDISSQGPSSLTYTSSTDPLAGGFQSRLQISIARNNRPKLPPKPRRPSSLAALVNNPAALSTRPFVGTSSQLSRPTTTMSAPTTPSAPAQSIALPSSSLPTTPVDGPSPSLGAIPRGSRIPSHESSPGYPTEYQAILADVPDDLKALITQQLMAKDRLAAVVAAEKESLEALEQEVEALDQELSPEEYERQLHSEIYQLQLECDKLAEKVDRASGSRVPLGETNAEFYQNIYTGQQFPPSSPSALPPPLPSQPPAWESEPSRTDNQDDPEGPPWFCSECTFANHPLMQICEECNTSRHPEAREGETQDIHIRVTHHHKLLPRRTLKNWAV